MPTLAVLGLGKNARGADFPLEIACPGWSAESAAQVEARVRATLLAGGLEARRVQINCAAFEVNVTVEAAQGSLTHPVAPRSPRIEDDVVAGVAAALRELQATRVEPTAPLEPAPPAAPPTPPAPAPPPATTVAPPAPAPARTVQITELGLAPVITRFSDHWALGAAVGLSVGSERFQYGLWLGGHSVLGLPASFAAFESHASGRVTIGLPKAAGLRASLGIGVSLLSASPGPNITSQSTTVSAGFLELHVSRPFWLGPIGLAPGAGLLFSARRKVRVNEQEQLVLPIVVPQADLSVLYRLP